MHRPILATLALLLLALPVHAEERFIVVASTTSTQDSGLFDYLLPLFSAKTGIEVRVVAKGTGQAIKLARNGDADVLLVHDRAAEDAFVAEGYGLARRAVMHNDFVIVGPAADPARIEGLTDAVAALQAIAAAHAPFASRGDDSGTHKAEQRLWAAAGVDANSASGTWYNETGSGMGQTLNTAVGLGAYALADRGSWAAFANKGDFALLVEGDARLANPYGVILVNPARFPHVHAAEAQAFVDWLLGPEGQGAIAAFRVEGQQVFFPEAPPPGS